MTLSDKSVRSYLSRHFTCAWTNLKGQASAGSSFAHSPKDPPGSCVRGNGEHNVQMLMLTPDGRLLNAVAGYVDSADLLTEAKLATSLWKQLRKAQPDSAKKLVRERHERWLKEWAAALGESRDPFARFSEARIRSDHGFSARHALMPAKDFKTEDLVGNARTFFGTSKGKKPKGRIGNDTDKRQKDRPRSKTGGSD